MATGSTHNDARGTRRGARAGEPLAARGPELALEQTQEILAVVPDEPRTRLIQAKALRALGRQDDAAAALTQLAAQFPLWAAPVLERGACWRRKARQRTPLPVCGVRSRWTRSGQAPGPRLAICSS
nr:hypothetical protein [Hankyongella ginsenosidimutans]